MIVERAIFAVKPGQAEDFKAAYPKALPHLAGSKGFVKAEMRQGIESPESFLLLVWWQTLEDHTVGFRESEGFVQWRAVLGPLFASPPAVEHYAAAL